MLKKSRRFYARYVFVCRRRRCLPRHGRIQWYLQEWREEGEDTIKI